GGDGIDATTALTAAIVGGLEEDPNGEVGRAAPLEQLDRAVKVDVDPRGDVRGRGGVVARPHELVGAPALDALELRFDDFFDRSHRHKTLLPPFFGKTNKAVHPRRRESAYPFRPWHDSSASTMSRSRWATSTRRSPGTGASSSSSCAAAAGAWRSSIWATSSSRSHATRSRTATASVTSASWSTTRRPSGVRSRGPASSSRPRRTARFTIRGETTCRSSTTARSSSRRRRRSCAAWDSRSARATGRSRSCARRDSRSADYRPCLPAARLCRPARARYSTVVLKECVTDWPSSVTVTPAVTFLCFRVFGTAKT